jgi:glycosyltransferase involved in cell wall biosynthesis
VNAKPTLLYVTPTVPATTGSGLVMRAAAVLRALSRHYRVTLLIVPLYRDRDDPVPEAVRACCERIVRLGTGPQLSPTERFDVVHVFRLAALSAAAPWLARAGARCLDLDDVESVSRRQIASLHARAGNAEAAQREETAAERARPAEDEALATFDRVYVCSEGDRELLLARKPRRAEVVVLPNTLPLPVISLPPPPAAPPTLLFVGLLGYAPNADALRWFCAEILPRIREWSGWPVRLRIVGRGAGREVRKLAARPGVELIGEAPEVAPYYQAAHAAIVPLRAGGGTRIKVLEAFALRRPVVTTTIGIAGIAAEPGRHALVNDDAGEFAMDCLCLLADPALATRLTDEAFALFRRSYTADALDAIIAGRSR